MQKILLNGIVAGAVTICAGQLPSSVVLAQMEIVHQAIEYDTDAQDPDPTTMPATTQAAEGAEDNLSDAEARLQRFMAIRFDRRLSSTLTAIAAPPNPDADEIQQFQADVILGRWDRVKECLASFDAGQGKQLYENILKQLLEGAEPQQPQQPQGSQPIIWPGDIVGLADASPQAPEESQIQTLGLLLSRALTNGDAIDEVIAALNERSEYFGNGSADTRLRTARLLIAAARADKAPPFLPAVDEALAAHDGKAIDLHVQCLLQHANGNTDPAVPIAEAFRLMQLVIDDPDVARDQRDVAMQRTIELLPRLDEDTSHRWIADSFTADHADRGTVLLSRAGADAARRFSTPDLNGRAQALLMQKQLVDTCLSAEGFKGADWSSTLSLLTLGWCQEAEYARDRPSQEELARNNQIAYGPRGERYYPHGGMNPNEMMPLGLAQLLEAAPNKAWLSAIEPRLAMKARILFAEIQLKNLQWQEALPLIEQIAAADPGTGARLADQTLTAWTNAHMPYVDRNLQEQQMYMIQYGIMNQGSPAIPQTRAAQRKSLAELKELLPRLKAIAADKPLNDERLVNAFTTVHSNAEVFRIEDIEAIFGSADTMPSASLTAIIRTMRTRLATTWRQQSTQQQAKTRRTDKQIEAEVTRGYGVMRDLLTRRIATGDDWAMQSTLGSVLFDWAEYDYGRQVELAVYTQRRDEAFAAFQRATELYATSLVGNETAEKSIQPFQQWFNAALGASDLAYLTRQAAPSKTELQQIRQAILNLPPDQIDWHVAACAESLTSMLQSIRAELKPRYVRAAMEILGNHKSTAKLAASAEYYANLLSEVELHTELDGDAAVGHGKPFGLHIGLRHTLELGQESGGFAKYLQNQQNAQYAYYMSYGQQGPVNYRDDFEKKIREALVEGFDIISITYHDDKTIEPRGFGREGWRLTPLAYVLLKAKDASIDRIPSMQLDLDFTDRQGQVILPVESQVVLINSRDDAPPPRPFGKIAVTQILDERNLDQGKLVLEIKASGTGVLPDLNHLVALKFDDFEIERQDEQALAVVKLNTDGDSITAQCERGWLINLKAREGTHPATFRFAANALPQNVDLVSTYQRYDDADLVTVEPRIALAGMPVGGRSYRSWIIGGIVVAVVIALVMALKRRTRRRPVQIDSRFMLPQSITPFSVIDLLQRIRRDDHLDPQHRVELDAAIGQLERSFFAPSSNGHDTIDLHRLATNWVDRTSRTTAR